MIDGIIKGEGNSRFLKSPASIPATFEEFRTALIAGTLPIDLLFNAAGWDVLGSLLNKANLLSDAVATALGLTTEETATVNNALNALMAVATQTANGLMSAADKVRLDGITPYVHPTTAGNKHIPIDGAADNILGYSASGTAAWIQQLAAKSLLGATVQGYYGGLTTVEAALKNILKKDNVVVLSSGTSWTPPRADMLVDVFLLGGGGGGGGSYNNVNGGNGGEGGTTYFDVANLLFAEGGKGGSFGSGSAVPGAGGIGGADGGKGGAAANAVAGANGNNTKYQASLGGYCPLNSTPYGGGGGGGAGYAGASAAGGVGGGGSGGVGATAGNPGTAYGAGGGGGGGAYGGGGGAGGYARYIKDYKLYRAVLSAIPYAIGAGGAAGTGTGTTSLAGGAGYQGVIIIGYNS